MSTNPDNRIIQAYLFFNGNCEQAVEFYRKALGAEVEMTMRFKESPEAPPPGMVPPNWDDKIMHTSFRVGQTTVMASDGCGPEAKGFQGFSLSLAVFTEAEADCYFNRRIRRLHDRRAALLVTFATVDPGSPSVAGRADDPGRCAGQWLSSSFLVFCSCTIIDHVTSSGGRAPLTVTSRSRSA
jgi:uncharacterized glyoxalase superfamily protein PhnB